MPLLEHHVTPLPGVVETLTELGTRHRLLLLTKGATDEQQRKIDASALAPHFEHVHIVAEKDVDTYRDLARHHDLDPATTWMIGNSPKSDVVPGAGGRAACGLHPQRRTRGRSSTPSSTPTTTASCSSRAVTELLDHF